MLVVTRVLGMTSLTRTLSFHFPDNRFIYDNNNKTPKCMYAKHLGRATFGAKSAQPNLSTFFSLAAYVWRMQCTGRWLLIHVTQEIRDIAALQCSKRTVYFQELW